MSTTISIHAVRLLERTRILSIRLAVLLSLLVGFLSPLHHHHDTEEQGSCLLCIVQHQAFSPEGAFSVSPLVRTGIAAETPCPVTAEPSRQVSAYRTRAPPSPAIPTA